jgi:hypothetical protein
MLAIRVLAVRAVHRLAVTMRNYPSRHLIILNNTTIFPIYRSELTVSENMVLDLEIKTQKKRKNIYVWQIR